MMPPLRPELRLHPGPTGTDGAPTWTLVDPARNRFFRLGWPVFEMLARWTLDSPQAIAQAVSDETPLSLAEDDVQTLVAFLAGNDLLRASTPEQVGRLNTVARAAKHSPAQRLLHGYLFFRIPLLRPDRALGRALPWLGWVFTQGFLFATLGALVVGLALAARRWDSFTATLVDMADPAGLVLYGGTLAAVKALHEIAHGIAAKRLGCRVPTMGVAFLVMWPVLYTDVNETWALTRRRDRLSVAAAGVLAELAVAAWATLAWGLLPDGGAKTAAFLLATTTWVSSLLLNLSPFMRFDGYFILMDALDLPNLHARAFALARWGLREALFDLGEPAPEAMAAGRQAALIAFAWFVWVYRLVLFLGIAVLVYHFFIKVVGIALFGVEIVWFVLRPLGAELREWWRVRRVIRAAPRARIPLVLLLVGLAAAVIPWQTRITAPAMLKSAQHLGLYAPTAGRLLRVAAAEGQRVAEGEALFVLDSPDLDHRLAQAERRIRVLEYELASQSFDTDLRDRAQALREELATVIAERLSLLRERSRATIRAPFAGRIVDPVPDLAPGQWVNPRERLAALAGDGPWVVEAYVGETEVGRLSPGDRGRFLADDPARAALPCRIVAIDHDSLRRLGEPALASSAGGPIAVRTGDKAAIPERALYRIRCQTDGAAPARPLRGVVLVDAAPESLLGATLGAVAAALLRESGL
jgi:putative peptide zinc metalloprotease protein